MSSCKREVTSPAEDAGHSVDEAWLIGHKYREHMLLLSLLKQLRLIYIDIPR